MPCSDGGPIRSVSDYEYDQVKKRLDKATRLLCELLTGFYESKEDGEFFDFVNNNNELQKWWKDHQKSDKEREKAEKGALVASAKSKLTKKELKAILDAIK